MGVATVNASYIISMPFSRSRAGHAGLAHSFLVSGGSFFSENASLVRLVVVTLQESADTR